MRRGLQVITIVVLLALLPVLMGPASARSYVSGNYMLELDGVNVGFVKSVSGGNAYADVVVEPAGSDPFVRKHIGQPKYEAFTTQIGLSMGKPMYDWISSSWQMNGQRRNGVVYTTDFNFNTTLSRNFYNAQLTETTIPAMDGASKEPAYITIKFEPEYTRTMKAGKEQKVAAASAKGEQKLWLPSNFRLEIDGLDTSKVNKIDAFTVKQTAVKEDIGDARDFKKDPGKLDFPNLKITLSAAAADSWTAWFEDFVVQGNNGQDKEKNGTLYMLATDRQTVLAKIKLFNMGVVSIGEVASEAGSDTIQRYQAELYVERMEFEVPTGNR
ncbi:MAG: phage tail protein [Bacillota bacterium]